MGPYAADRANDTYSRSIHALAERLRWPAFVADELIQLSTDYPRMHVWWSNDGNQGRSETHGAGFYAQHEELRHRKWPAYHGKTANELRIALLDEENAQPETATFKPLIVKENE